MADKTIKLLLTSTVDADTIYRHIKTIRDNKCVAPVVLAVAGTHKAFTKAMNIITNVASADVVHDVLMQLTDMLKVDKALPPYVNIRFDGSTHATYAIYLL